MNKLVLTAVLSALGAVACSHLREPDDAQLANLLLGERANPLDANARLDVRVIECMRAWSGNADLLKGLAVRYAGEDGKRSCRTSLDARLADQARNPDRFTFDEISAPKTVRRALSLQESRKLAALTDTAQRQPPTSLTRPRVAGPKLLPPDPKLDLGVAGTRLKEAEDLCLKAQQAASGNDDLQRFADYCTGALRRLRSNMQTTARNGLGAEQLDPYARSADNLANTARELLAAPRP